ncbi:MAG: glycosyltransferase family 2 protein [Chloroflexota bacterium]|nr:glycosyltransferase family 2 protein [Chloroflexota bacterium]
MAATTEVPPHEPESALSTLGTPGLPASSDGQLLAMLASATITSGSARPARPANVSLRLDSFRVSVVIPALNEAQNLPLVLHRIPPWVHEVLLIDGHSTDATVTVARQLYPSIQIISQQGRGKGAALRTGFAAATGDIIIMLDADGSTDPAEMPVFVGALLAGADFAKGSRFVQGGGTADMPLYRQLGNWAFVLAVRLLMGGSYTDLCYGYNAFWARVLPALNLDADGFEIETSMNVRALLCGLRIMEVPSFEAKRVYGTGRLRTIPDGWRIVKTIWRETRLRGRAKMLVRGSAGV